MLRSIHQVGGLFCIGVMLGSAGCATYQPRPLIPAEELAGLRRASVETVRTLRSAGDVPASHPAFDPADGLSEAEVAAVALRLNPELQAARAKAGIADAALITAGMWPNPEVGIGWRGGLGDASGYKLEADALFELLRPGERQARRTAAEARIDETKAEIIAAEYRTAAEARRQWLEVLAAEQTVSLLGEEAALRGKAVEMIEQRRRLGEATEMDLAVARLDAAEVQRDRRRAESELQAARQELNRILGLPPDYALRLSDSGQPLRVLVYDEPGDTELDKLLLTGRWELRSKEAAYRQAEQELRLAVLEQFPRLKLGPSFERESGEGNFLGIGAGLELPIFNQNQGRIAEATAARDTARAEYVSLLHRLRAEAFAARDHLRRARLEVDEQEREVLPLVRRSEELFEKAYRARELSVLEWLTAQQRALKARRDYLDAVVRYRKLLIELEAAAGRSISHPATQPATSRSNTSNDKIGQTNDDRRPS